MFTQFAKICLAGAAAVMFAGCASSGRQTDFAWPSDGKVIAGFGQPYEASRSEGLIFELHPGDPVRAAAPGVVAFAEFWSPVGYMIVLEHEGGIHTIYAGSIISQVKLGDTVAKGQIIAAGAEPTEGKPSTLTFEIRKEGDAVDPRTMLDRRSRP